MLTSNAFGVAHHENYEREAYPCFGSIHRAAVRLVRQNAEAEDLTQEVFLQAWRSFDRYEPGTNCKAWLFRILWNVHHQRMRKRQPMPLGVEGEERLAATLVARETTPTEVSDANMKSALDRVSPEHRRLLILSDVEGFTYKEIAAALSIPIGTVMSRLSRAREALRGALAQTGGPAARRRSEPHKQRRGTSQKAQMAM